MGMLRLLEVQKEETLKSLKGDDRKGSLSFATGHLAYPFIQDYAHRLLGKYPNLRINGYEIKNEFFGEQITVSGLLTGQDIVKQLKGKPLGEFLLLPCNLLRDEENVFLDDMTVEQLEEELGVPVKIVEEHGRDFAAAALKEDTGKSYKRRQMYEQTNSSYSGTA